MCNLQEKVVISNYACIDILLATFERETCTTKIVQQRLYRRCTNFQSIRAEEGVVEESNEEHDVETDPRQGEDYHQRDQHQHQLKQNTNRTIRVESNEPTSLPVLFIARLLTALIFSITSL